MTTSGDERHARDAVDTVARRSYGKLMALLATRTQDVAAAEDALSDAFASALTDWARNGTPATPEAWLLTVARRKLIDRARREYSNDAAATQLSQHASPAYLMGGADIPDNRLALMFTCAHPAIDPAIRAPLMLQVVLGLDAATIASAFLVSPTTMGQRLVRAKQKIRQAGIPFRVPEREELPERVDAVLDAIYAIFGEGWTDPSGTDELRRDLSDEALFLGRLITELLPDTAEAMGLLALMLHAEARRHARRSADGDYVPLAAQDPAQWDHAMIDEAERLLHRASRLGVIGRYQLEAALQSAHVDRRRTGRSTGRSIIELYDALFALHPSPVIAINRAVAIADVDGPAAGLELLRQIADDTRLQEYQPYWAARAELLAKAGADEDAHHAYDIAIGLTSDPAVRRVLQQNQARHGR